MTTELYNAMLDKEIKIMIDVQVNSEKRRGLFNRWYFAFLRFPTMAHIISKKMVD